MQTFTAIGEPLRRSEVRLAAHAARAHSTMRRDLGAMCESEFARLHRLLSRSAGARLLRCIDVEDLVQEALLEAVRRYPSYAPQGADSFFRWLSKLSVHKMHNLRRREFAARRDVRRLESTASDDEQLAIPSAKPDPSTIAEVREQIERCWQQLGSMPSDDQHVVREALVEGRGVGEIASDMGSSKNSVALRLSRTLRKLRERCAPVRGSTRP